MCELKLNILQTIQKSEGHTLTGVWVEIGPTMPSLYPNSHTLTGVWVEILQFRVREFTDSHTLTGVWVEIQIQTISIIFSISHTLTGVWVEINSDVLIELKSMSHPHGCVSWNPKKLQIWLCQLVTPSRVCELKSVTWHKLSSAICHTLTGVWVEIMNRPLRGYDYCHTLTGVWVEILPERSMYQSFAVTPSRVCELKLQTWLKHMVSR